MAAQEAVVKIKGAESVRTTEEEILELAEHRLIGLNKLSDLKDQLKGLKEDIKDVQADVDGIDHVFQEKFDHLNELRNKKG